MVALSVALFSCGQKKQAGWNAGIPEYAVITVEPASIELNSSYPATIRGRQDVEIRPNVSGFITELCIDEGATVKKGQPLFIIDQVQYGEAVKQAEAAVNVARASVNTAKLTAANKRQLEQKNIISEYDRQMSDNQLASAEAQLAQAEAQLANARKNLSYTTVTSPVNGVAGNIPFRVGSLVSPSLTVPLTTVSDISQMYVYFSMNEKELLEMSRRFEGNHGPLNSFPQVQLRLADGSVYPYKGKIETLSGVIDPVTGAVSVRATFPNPDRLLRSGGSGVVMIPVKDDNALVIPQKASYEIQDKRFVYIVSDSSKVASQQVQVLPIDNGQQFVVTSGLNAGDRIVVEGVGTSVRDGMTIKAITPEEAQAKLQGAVQMQQAQAAQASQR